MLRPGRWGRGCLTVSGVALAGKGFSEVEDRDGWHGKPFPEEMAVRAIAQLGGVSDLVVRGPLPDQGTAVTDRAAPVPQAADEVRYRVGDAVATRKAYGDALVGLGSANARVVALDAEVSNSTHADQFAKAFPGRFFEMFIAEQQLVAAAVGLSVRGYVAFASTFAAFFTRAFDFIRMAAISQASIRLVGSHAGVEIGADGPSQMALEDLAMMRAVHGSTVLYPSDATSTAALVHAMAETSGIVYLRTTRGAYPGLYGDGEQFPVGGAKVPRSGPDDQVTLVGAGVTVHECLAAADKLAQEGIAARVVDLYSVKPVDADTLIEALSVTAGRMVITEDHHPEGGVGAAVLEALADRALSASPRIVHLAVRDMPGSGTSRELLHAAGIDAEHIASAAQELLKNS